MVYFSVWIGKCGWSSRTTYWSSGAIWILEFWFWISECWYHTLKTRFMPDFAVVDHRLSNYIVVSFQSNRLAVPAFHTKRQFFWRPFKNSKGKVQASITKHFPPSPGLGTHGLTADATGSLISLHVAMKNELQRHVDVYKQALHKLEELVRAKQWYNDAMIDWLVESLFR